MKTVSFEKKLWSACAVPSRFALQWQLGWQWAGT
jgi:hypothetical protein